MRYLLCASWTKQKADACLDFSHFFILNFARDIWSCGLVNGLHEMYGHVHMIYISQNFYFMVNLKSFVTMIVKYQWVLSCTFTLHFLTVINGRYLQKLN